MTGLTEDRKSDMTGTQLAAEAKTLTKECWVSSAGVTVLLLLFTALLAKRDMVTVAVIIVGVHTCMVVWGYIRERQDRNHRLEIAVAYVESLKAEQEPPTHDITRPERPAADRHRGTAVVVRQDRRQLVGVHA